MFFWPLKGYAWPNFFFPSSLVVPSTHFTFPSSCCRIMTFRSCSYLALGEDGGIETAQLHIYFLVCHFRADWNTFTLCVWNRRHGKYITKDYTVVFWRETTDRNIFSEVIRSLRVWNMSKASKFTFFVAEANIDFSWREKLWRRKTKSLFLLLWFSFELISTRRFLISLFNSKIKSELYLISYGMNEILKLRIKFDSNLNYKEHKNCQFLHLEKFSFNNSAPLFHQLRANNL